MTVNGYWMNWHLIFRWLNLGRRNCSIYLIHFEFFCRHWDTNDGKNLESSISDSKPWSKIFSSLRLQCFEAVSWGESLNCQHRSLFQCQKVQSNNLCARLFFFIISSFFFFFFIFGDLCIYCKLGAEVASPVSAAKLGWTSMLVAAGANFPRCSLMVLQECMVFSIGKPHRIWFGIITTTAVEHLGGCLLKGVQVAECF